MSRMVGRKPNMSTNRYDPRPLPLALRMDQRGIARAIGGFHFDVGVHHVGAGRGGGAGRGNGARRQRERREISARNLVCIVGHMNTLESE